MCKDRKKLSNTEQKITKCNKKAFHVEHCKRFTWNIASVSRGTSQAFHVEHQRRTGEGGCVRLRFFLLLVRACVLGCGRLRSSSLLPPPCSGLRARLWAAALALLSCRPRLCALRPLCVVVCRSPLLPSSPVRASPSLRRRPSLASLAVLACARFALSASSSCARLSCRPRLCALRPLCVVVWRSPLLPPLLPPRG